jgi:hypothetical protein
MERLLEELQVALFKAEFGEIKLKARPIEDVQNGPFSVVCWKRRETNRDRLVVSTHLEATLLRALGLFDMELGHSLETAGERYRLIDRELEGLMKNTVNAVTDSECMLKWLEVNIGCTEPHCAADQPVGESNR